MRIEEFIFYKDMKDGEILYEFPQILRNKSKEPVYAWLHKIYEFSVEHGFYGNLWHAYLTYLLTGHENAYSLSCELREGTKGSVSRIASHDFGIFHQLFKFDFKKEGERLGVSELSMIEEFEGNTEEGRVFNRRIRNQILDLCKKLEQAESKEDFQSEVLKFYHKFGVGSFGLHKAFRIEEENKKLEIYPINKIAHVNLDDLIGYDTAKNKLLENTRAFVEGKKANNCLLYGDAGTGKSSSIKAILNQFYEDGLRMIEIYKHQFKHINDVIARIKNRNYKFILYMDDLSFEEFEIEYKYLKAVIEGGLEKKPENVLIYATSNRRHLIRESFRDKRERDEDLHTNDTVQEKLSLSARFGVKIYFGRPEKTEFQEIVIGLAKRNGIHMEEEELLLEANRWELTHGGMSGRTAQQFVDYLLGKY